MSIVPDEFRYHFYPVGQGLFACGLLLRSSESGPRYCWVYDCGTSSADELISAAIERLSRALGSRQRLDLVALSHFDHDHISGVCRLIENFKIGTLMLPYLTLAQRLILAFAEGLEPRDELTEFLLNPVAYLLARSGPGIERILFVPASGGEGPPLPDGTPGDPHWGGDNPDIRFPPDKPKDPEEWTPLSEAPRAAGMQTRVEFLRRGGAIYVGSLWEFVPYNDDPENQIPADFRDRVREERARLLGVNGRRSRNNALRRLRQIYDEQFGDSSDERNVISLFLYSGPIYSSWEQTWIYDVWQSFGFRGLRPVFRSRSFRATRSLGSPRACSIIYSGDGYLDTTERLQRLAHYLRQQRIECTGLFQVMHHGAEANWHKGVAATIAPFVSVFSSDPERKLWGHPHASVLRDFWPYGPCQVDKRRGVTSAGRLQA